MPAVNTSPPAAIEIKRARRVRYARIAPLRGGDR